MERTKENEDERKNYSISCLRSLWVLHWMCFARLTNHSGRNLHQTNDSNSSGNIRIWRLKNSVLDACCPICQYTRKNIPSLKLRSYLIYSLININRYFQSIYLGKRKKLLSKNSQKGHKQEPVSRQDNAKMPIWTWFKREYWYLINFSFTNQSAANWVGWGSQEKLVHKMGGFSADVPRSILTKFSDR